MVVFIRACERKMVWVLLLLLLVAQQEETAAVAEDNGPVKEEQKEDVVTTVSQDSMAQEGRKQLELMTKEAQMPV